MQARDIALSERHDAHAGEREPLEESCGVFLVPTESIQRLGEHDVESLIQRASHQRLEAGSKQGGTGNRVIGEHSSMIVQSCRLANCRQTRSWSAIDASRWLSDEYRA